MATLPSLRQRVSTRVLELARARLAGTPVERLRITGWLRGAVFRVGFGGRDEEWTATIGRVSLTLPKGHGAVVSGLMAGYYERLEIELFSELAGAAKKIVDVGGNIGLYACIAGTEMDAGEVVTFEPEPGNAALLRRNVERNGLDANVRIVEQAVSDETGSARLYLSDDIGNHSLASDSARSKRYVDVEVTTIDLSFPEDQIDVLKVDVEGFDINVLRGAERILKNCRPTLFVEFDPEGLAEARQSPRELAALIADNYEQIFFVDEPKAMIAKISPEQLITKADTLARTNLIAVSRADHAAIVEDFLQRRVRATSEPRR